MIKFFRNIRKTLIEENKTSKYLKYAIGEIVLVVIGILIALQVNNWNIDRNDRKEEVKYLENIKQDLEKDTTRLAFLINFRKERLRGDRKIIQHINGLPIDDVTELTKSVVNTVMEENFIHNNNTYSELSSSGNLNLISNDSIKSLLLELEMLYKINRLGIEHETYDYREYVSKSLNKYVDIDQLFPVYKGQKTIGEQKISNNDFNALLESKEYKNGLFHITAMSVDYIRLYEEIDAKSKTIIQTLQKELNN